MKAFKFTSKAPGPEPVPNPEIAELKEQVAKLQAEVADAKTLGQGPEHPASPTLEVAELKQQVTRLQAEAAETKALVNQLVRMLLRDNPEHTTSAARLRAAADLGMDAFHTTTTLAPLLDAASMDGGSKQKDITSDKTTSIMAMPVFHGFSDVCQAADTMQESAKKNAVKLLLLMLRCLAVNSQARADLRAALVSRFTSPADAAWKTLNRRLYDAWNETQFDSMLSAVVGSEQLASGYEFEKHTRVAAMLMVGLLMQEGLVLV